LTYACENGHTDVAEVLLEHGAELVSFAFWYTTGLCINYSLGIIALIGMLMP